MLQTNMMSDELIKKLKDVQKRAGKPLPVIHWSGGDIDTVQVGYDVVKQRDEVWLLEGKMV
jgi:hypothetical protein